MTHTWKITAKDIKLVRQVCEEQKNHKIFIRRQKINVETKSLNISKEVFWKCIFTCLLTTQQRSSEDSRINEFLKSGYSKIGLTKLSRQKNIKKYIASQLKGFGGIRRTKLIPIEAETIYKYLIQSEWNLLKRVNNFSKEKGNKYRERELANEIVEEKGFKGLGPKQSRNLLQMLGYSIYEIPIDSRITDWLNANNIFPFKLNSKGLSDIEFYCFLNDAIIELCEKAGVKPCMFDAAVFSSKENRVRS